MIQLSINIIIIQNFSTYDIDQFGISFDEVKHYYKIIS